MSRGLIAFLGFLVVLSLLLGLVAYVLGPNVLAFIFHAERRTEPVVIVNLLDFADAQASDAYHTQFDRPAAALIDALGGKEIWAASASDVIHGGVLDGWSALQLVGYPSRAAFIELVTSSDYRALLDARRNALKRDAVLSATPALAFDLQGTQAQAVRFLIGARDDSIQSFDTKWLVEETQMLERHEGKLIWRARLNPLVAAPEQRFGEMLIYGFVDAAHRDEWANDPQRETLQTLQRRLFRRDVIIASDTRIDPDAMSVTAPVDSQTTPNEPAASALEQPEVAPADPNTEEQLETVPDES
jgi:uncharacterized protein (DUF1330 family)